MNSLEYQRELLTWAKKEKILALVSDDPQEIRSHRNNATKHLVRAKRLTNMIGVQYAAFNH